MFGAQMLRQGLLVFMDHKRRREGKNSPREGEGRGLFLKLWVRNS